MTANLVVVLAAGTRDVRTPTRRGLELSAAAEVKPEPFGYQLPVVAG